MDNSVQQTNWNGPGARSWVRLQKQIDRAVEPFHAAGCEALAAKAGERIIDIGCGSGTGSLALADAVGEDGKVLGLDFSEPLLELAHKRCAGRSQISFQHGDAGQPRAEREFDALYSRFGVMFFEQPARAFENLRQTLKPGGRLAFACWQGLEQNPWIHEPLARMIPFLPEAPSAPKPNSPGAFGLADPDFTKAELLQAGFRNISIEGVRRDAVLGTEGVPSAVEFNMQLGPVANLAGDLPPETLEQIRASFADLFEPHCHDSVVTLPASVWIITASC
ncbi:MAG: SAM-dependent methyltransferase [Glaciecola sp.]|jgi:SAM-dependent methyltransferase